MGDKRGVATALINLAGTALADGDDATARPLYKEGVLHFHELGEKRGLAFCLEGLAAVAGGQGQPERTVRLFAAAAALRDAIGAPLPAGDRAVYDRILAAVHDSLGPEKFGAAWDAGRVLSLEQALAEAVNLA